MLRLLLVLLCLASCPVWAARHIVLVPGFFSSAVPAPVAEGSPWKQPYFSQDIVKYLARTGDRVWVVDNLNPVGGIEENGQRLLTFLRKHQSEMPGSWLLISHSAGGLYSLYAASHSDLPIDHVITLSTPFQGLEILKNLAKAQIPLEALATPFCLENLLGLKEEAVVKFLKELQFRRPLKLDVFAGYQRVSAMTWDWQYLSAALVPFQALILQKSDGIVSVQSALAAGTLLQKKPFLQTKVHQEEIELEHWEQILDADFSLPLGVLNISSLRNAQTWAYYYLLQRSGALKEAQPSSKSAQQIQH